MDDIYSALIGGAPSDEAIQMKLAEQLRNQRKSGELAMLSGHSRLMPVGQHLSGSADAFAKQLQDIRQKDADNRQTKAYQDAQIKHMGDVLAETRRGNTLDYLASLNRDATSLQKDSNSGPNYRKISDGRSKRLEDTAGTFYDFDSLMSSYKPEYASSGVWKTNEARVAWANANPGLATQQAKDAARWWAEAQRFSNLPERYRLFGATLTTNELKSWKEATFNPGDTDDQIRAKMRTIKEIYRKSIERMRNNAIREGYDPEMVMGYFEGIEMGEAPSGPGRAGGSSTRVQQTTESADGVDITQLSDEDLQRIINGP